MNYKDIVEVIKEISETHFFINTWGYGEISDIMTPNNQEPPDYPYIFMNPVSIGGGDRSDSFTFNLICMTQAYDTETDIIEEQSNCLVYLKDVISRVNLTLDHPLIQFIEPYTFTPFKERFQDDVVGFTATMTIQYSNSLDICNAAITNLPKTPAFPNCPQVLVIDGDETVHLVQAGETYTCLPATAKSGIVYQRIIPWDQNDPRVDGSVAYNRAQGVYDYAPPKNPVSTALLQNKYVGSDAGALLMYDNAFGNKYRFTNDVGEQFVEGFAESSANSSINKRYCIDHYTGLGWYIQDAGDYNQITMLEAMAYSLTFSYNGYSDWRLADISEYLNSVNYNDWSNSYTSVYAPFVDNIIRNYGGELATGTYTKDNQYIFVNTNGGTVTPTSANATPRHQLLIRNHYI